MKSVRQERWGHLRLAAVYPVIGVGGFVFDADPTSPTPMVTC